MIAQVINCKVFVVKVILSRLFLVKFCWVTSGVKVGEVRLEVMDRSLDESLPYHVLLLEGAAIVCPRDKRGVSKWV